jgi:hypothetical protein
MNREEIEERGGAGKRLSGRVLLAGVELVDAVVALLKKKILAYLADPMSFN